MIVTEDDPSNITEPPTSPEREIVLAVCNLVAVPALPEMVVTAALALSSVKYK